MNGSPPKGAIVVAVPPDLPEEPPKPLPTNGAPKKYLSNAELKELFKLYHASLARTESGLKELAAEKRRASDICERIQKGSKLKTFRVVRERGTPPRIYIAMHKRNLEGVVTWFFREPGRTGPSLDIEFDD